MRNWVWSFAVLGSACVMGPNEEQLRCYQVCSRDKDACMLAANTAAAIQECDTRSSRCTAGCEAR